ncbi:MAG: winged helix-turn-helix domain-containing protein [Candidatus Promineifilaceae bacterium]
MAAGRSWANYPITYRRAEMETLAEWIRLGASGAVVGPAGSGKSNLLGFLCNRPDALQRYLAAGTGAVALIPVDLNNLPATDVATLYRVILRGFHEARDRLDGDLQPVVERLFMENRAATDPFLAQSALRELLFAFEARQVRVTLVLDRFDLFWQQGEPRLTDTLRGLRDSFKGVISYLVGMRQAVAYLPDPAALGELQELLDTYVCWVKPLVATDARYLIADETGACPEDLDDDLVAWLLELSGGYPALLKATCHWWSAVGRPARYVAATDRLLAHPPIQHRLGEVWRYLTLAEQQLLVEMHRGVPAPAVSTAAGRNVSGLPQFDEQRAEIGLILGEKGLLALDGDEWRLASGLLDAYLDQAAVPGPGGLWIDERTHTLYQGRDPLDNLSPLEGSLLSFFVSQPRTRHTYTALIEAAWPEDVSREGVSNEALYQVVRGLRRKIEPDPSRPHYIVNWRGFPEGGYQCFPEGRPG